MQDVLALLQNHRSIRRFKDKPLEKGLLNELLRAGQSAATSSFIQAVSVVRVTDHEIRQRFVELSGGQKYVGTAPEFLIFCADLSRNSERVKSLDGEPDFGWAEQFIAATVDVALFAQNVVVAAQSQGLGICYIGGIRNDPQQVCDLLALPNLVYPVFGLCLGYPDQHPERKPRLPLSVVCHENQYQASQNSGADIQLYDEHVKAYYINRSGGKLDFTWSAQMKSQAETQSRPFMRDFLQDKGFLIK